jgi:hypothetical protein
VRALAPIYRAPMRSRTRETPPGAGAEFALARSLVGIGEPVDASPASLAEAVLVVTQAHGAKAGRMLSGFAGLPEGTFVWTRQADGDYRSGRISGPWRYDTSRAAREVGIPHVRAAVWSPRHFGEGDVPPGVSRAFARGGRNFQRAHDREAERRTAEHWHQPAH